MPVTHILPEANINAVARGSRSLIMTAPNRFGLYSVFRHRKAICFKSSFTPKFAVGWGVGNQKEINRLMNNYYKTTFREFLKNLTRCCNILQSDVAFSTNAIGSLQN